jgi:hypothetical protein
LVHNLKLARKGVEKYGEAKSRRQVGKSVMVIILNWLPNLRGFFLASFTPSPILFCAADGRGSAAGAGVAQPDGTPEQPQKAPRIN